MAVVAGKGYETDTYQSDTLTTGANYSDANTVTWTCPHLSHKTIIIQNEGSSQSLTYKVEVRTYKSGNQFQFKTGTVAKSAQLMVALNNVYYDVVIAVKNGDGSTAATIEYCGRLLA